ncbi:MAG: hypothetical protein Ct9H90mP9_4710 [Pseudomonadota bacterium]|nr:MAG: hypothetical protein Ct9H90mP9_4710 [Pseudomonadota bacterium]
MIKVDFHLGTARFMGQGIDIQSLSFAEVIHFLKKRIEFIQCVNFRKIDR